MRSAILAGVAALSAFVAADKTGEIVAYATTSDGVFVPILTKEPVYVTVTPTDCTAAGECSDAASSIPPSTGTTNALTIPTSPLLQRASPSSQAQSPSINALTVLSQAESQFTATQSQPTTTNALSVLSQAESQFTATQSQPTTTNALSVLKSALQTNPVVPPVTFAPAVFTSYGLTETTGSPSETAPVSTGSVPPAYSSNSAGTMGSSPASSEVSPVNTSAAGSTTGTMVIPTGLTGSALSSYTASEASTALGSATASTATTGGITGVSSTMKTATGSPTGVETGATKTGATTTAAPAAATNGAINKKPAAIGVVAVLGALVFV